MASLTLCMCKKDKTTTVSRYFHWRYKLIKINGHKLLIHIGRIFFPLRVALMRIEFVLKSIKL